jgi:8-oxo-dGTP diphosphatase
MKLVTLCLPIDEQKRQVLLGLKKRGFGQGKLVGLGGKVEPGEALVAAAVRELREEAGLWVDSDRLDAVARLTFLFPARPDWDHLMVIFLVRAWCGEPRACDEIQPQWHPIDALPFDHMWDDGRYWLPQVLAGQRLAATFVYGEDLETVVDFEQSDANQRRSDQDDAEICIDHENLRPDPPKSRDTLRLTPDT